MTGRFIYSPRAERQLNEINDWITRSASADVAKRFLTAVRAHIESLSTFPLAGSAHGDIRSGLRTTTFKKRTVIAYVVDEDSGGRVITVLGVFHGGQDWMRALSTDEDPAPRCRLVPLACPIRTNLDHSPQSQTDSRRVPGTPTASLTGRGAGPRGRARCVPDRKRSAPLQTYSNNSRPPEK